MNVVLAERLTADSKASGITLLLGKDLVNITWAISFLKKMEREKRTGELAGTFKFAIQPVVRIVNPRRVARSVPRRDAPRSHVFPRLLLPSHFRSSAHFTRRATIIFKARLIT